MKDFKKALLQLEKTLEFYLKEKSPFSLPENIKILIVTFLPYFLIIGLIFSLPSFLAFFGRIRILPFYESWLPQKPFFSYQFSNLVAFLAMIFQAISLPYLFKRKKEGWQLVYYATLIWILYSLFWFDLIGGIISGLISLYLLFQVKEYYR